VLAAVAVPLGPWLYTMYFMWTLPAFPKIPYPMTPDSPEGKVLFRVIAAEHAKDYQRAVDILSDYLDHERERGWNTVFFLQQRAGEYEKLEQYDRAEADLTAAINVTPYAVTSYVKRGEFYMRRRRDKAALADFETGSKRDPHSGLFPFKEGELYAARGEYQRAIERFGEAIRREPNKRNYYYERGSAYNFAHMYPEARTDFDTALSIDNSKISARERVRPKLGRGFAELQIGQYHEAIADFDAVLAVVPRASNALAWRGSARQMLGEKEPAIADFKAALAIDPHHEWAAEKLKELEPAAR
jgi:tetratricopeptide (TPR) repeat protein